MMPPNVIQLFPSGPPDDPKPARATYAHSSGKKRKHFRYTDAQGVSRQHTVYGATAAEAERNKQAFLADVAASLRVDQRGKTVSAWCDEWLQKYKSNVRASTRTGYVNDLRHIKKAVGARPLRAVLPADLQALMDSRAGLSASAIKKTAMTIRAVFQAAFTNRLIPYDPSAGLRVPKGSVGTHRALSAAEQAIVEQVAQTHRFGFVAMLMLWGGLRMGEACAFDPAHCVRGDDLVVRNSVEWINNKPRLAPPKTAAGIRTAPIYPKLRPFIARARGAGYAASSAGAPTRLITRSAFDRGWESFCTACDEALNRCSKRWQPEGHVWRTMALRTHDLRHTWFTMLYDTGVDAKVAASWGGHGDITVTMRIYQHIRDQRKRDEFARSVQQLDAQHKPGDNFGDNPKGETRII